MQNEEAGQETELASCIAGPGPCVQRVPSYVSALPSRSMATQKAGVAQETSNSRSEAAAEVGVDGDAGRPGWEGNAAADQDVPSKVPTVFGPPGAALAPTVAQKSVVGQDIR